jgi:hypothetical protein
MDKLIPEKAQGKEVVQFISHPVATRNTDNFNLNSCNNSTQAMLIADMRVYARILTSSYKLVRLLVNVYCKHALIIESTRNVGQSKM